METLKNDLDVIDSTIKNEKNESELKKILYVIVNFMDDQYKFRYPNLISLNILDDYLNQEVVTCINTGRYNSK